MNISKGIFCPFEDIDTSAFFVVPISYLDNRICIYPDWGSEAASAMIRRVICGERAKGQPDRCRQFIPAGNKSSAALALVFDDNVPRFIGQCRDIG